MNKESNIRNQRISEKIENGRSLRIESKEEN